MDKTKNVPLPAEASCCNETLFFSKVPRNVSEDELYEIFSRFGQITELKLFKRWPTAKTSMGCGIISYKRPEQAMAAVLALSGTHYFTSGDVPMVLEWADPSRLTHTKTEDAPNPSKQQETKSYSSTGLAPPDPTGFSSSCQVLTIMDPQVLPPASNLASMNPILPSVAAAQSLQQVRYGQPTSQFGPMLKLAGTLFGPSLLSSTGSSSSRISDAQQQQDQGTFIKYIPLPTVVACQLVNQMHHISKMSGAEVAMATIPSQDDVYLRMSGSRAAVDLATSLAQLLITHGGSA